MFFYHVPLSIVVVLLCNLIVNIISSNNEKGSASSFGKCASVTANLERDVRWPIPENPSPSGVGAVISADIEYWCSNPESLIRAEC